MMIKMIKDMLRCGVAGVLFAWLMVWGLCCSIDAEYCASQGLGYDYTSILLVGYCK